MKKILVVIFIVILGIPSFSLTHLVRSGDTLETISKKYHISQSQLMTRNQLSTTSVRRGRTLDVGGDGIHIVVYGESLGRIAKAYKLSTTELRRLNNLKDNTIHPGQHLRIESINQTKKTIANAKPSTLGRLTKSIVQQLKYNEPKMLHHFTIKEFVDKATYKKYGEKSVWFVDRNLIAQMNQLRDLFGREITINNWATGGRFQWRGFRTPSSPNYNVYSSHSFGRAADFDVAGLTASQARAKIIQWYREGILVSKSINLEVDVNWVHLDIRNGESLRTFRP